MIKLINIINEIIVNKPITDIKKAIYELWAWFHNNEKSVKLGGMSKRFDVLNKTSKLMNSGYNFGTVIEKLSKEQLNNLYNNLLELKKEIENK